jgi:hypothetical protein
VPGQQVFFLLATGSHQALTSVDSVLSVGVAAARWTLRAVLEGSGGRVASVRFAPAESGLWLAAAATDGGVRLWESPAAALTAERWELHSAFATLGAAQPTALAWCPAPRGPPLLAVPCRASGSSGACVCPASSPPSCLRLYRHPASSSRWLSATPREGAASS